MRYFNTQGVFYQYNVRRKLPWMRILEIIISTLFLLAFLGFAYQIIFTQIDKSRYKVKGKMVDAGGYRLFTHATGDGKFTIVLESDIGMPYQQWDKVKEHMAMQSRVFTYERAGFGLSDKGNAPRDISRAIKDLRTVLKKSAAKPPYILVGHGYGGMIMMKFAEQYPEDVSALVLIDSWTEGYIKSEGFRHKLGKELIKTQFFKYSSYLGISRLAQQLNILKVKGNESSNLTEIALDAYKSNRITAKYNRARYEELNGLKGYDENLKIDGLLGNKPVYVLTLANHGFEDEEERRWGEWQRELLRLSTKSEFIELEDSSTYIHKDRPEEIVNVLYTIIKKIGIY